MQTGDKTMPDSKHDSHTPNNEPGNTSPPSKSGFNHYDSAAPSSGWQYKSDETYQQHEAEPISWSASEYIDHEKQFTWYLAVAGVSILLTVIVYLLTRDIVNGIVILVVASLFVVLGARKPLTLQYGLDSRGIHIGNKFYGYDEFRSFAVIDEGALNSIQLSQFKRIATPITLYFPPEQEQEIINFLGDYLPHEIRSHDAIERLMRKVRF